MVDYVNAKNGFGLDLTRAYFEQLIDVVSYCHNNGTVHRDLKLENILFDSEGIIKVADFGFAGPIMGRDGESGFLDTYCGTKSYMAPEILQKIKYKGAEVDVFACGVILYIMVMGKLPFKEAKPKDPNYKVLALQKYEIFWKFSC